MSLVRKAVKTDYFWLVYLNLVAGVPSDFFDFPSGLCYQ